MSTPNRLRTLLTQGGGFVVAGVLLWLALRGVELEQVGHDLARGDYRWLAPMVAVTLASHLVRAWRWRLLLAGLPGARPPSLAVAYGAVMMGYAANYVLPRAGEVIRTGVVARDTGQPFASVFGTVVLDRLLDMAMLALGLLTLPFLLRERLAPVTALFFVPARDRVLALPSSVLMGAGVLLLAGAAGAIWWWRSRSARQVQDPSGQPQGRLARLMASFGGGLKALVHAPHRGALVASTVVMWGLYALMAYIPFLLLRTAEPYGLTLLDGWCIMLLGAIGMVVPSPGGAGSFHYVTILTLTQIWNMGRADAATYAVLAHAAQLVVYAAAGAVSLLVFSLKRAPRAAPSHTDA